jgi:hypothetical protein
MKLALAFGPLRCALCLDGAALPHELLRWQTPPLPGEETWTVRCSALPETLGPEDFRGEGYVVTGRTIVLAPGRPRAIVTALAALLAHRAPRDGCVVVHAAAVRVVGGVALLLAPSGTGKTTLAALAASRSFAHNAVVVATEPVPTAWAFPFAGDARPELNAVGTARVRVSARLVRGEHPGFEWLPRSSATTLIVRHCVRAPVGDTLARERFMIASALASKVPHGQLLSTRSLHDLDPLDRALATEPPP